MVILCALLLCEYVFLSISFDIGLLLKENTAFRVLGYIGTVAPLAMIIATSLVLVSGSRLRKDIVDIANATPYKKSVHLWIIHAVSYLGLVLTTPLIFSTPQLLPIWTICAFLVSGTGLYLALPPYFFFRLVRRSGRLLLTGCIVGAIAWIAGLFFEKLWESLGYLTFENVRFLVNLLPGEKIIDASQNLVGTKDFSIRIAPVCAGYQGIGLITVFISAYLFIKRKELRFPVALLLLPSAIILAWAFNAFRIFSLITIGTFGFPEIALGGFHAKAGWILFCALALGIVAFTQRAGFFINTPDDSHKDATWNPTAAYLLPFLTAIALAMITGLVSVSEIDLGYPVRIIGAFVVFAIYRRHIHPLNISFSWFAVGIGIAVAIIWIGLDTLLSENSHNSAPVYLAALPTASMLIWIVFRVIGSCIVIPLIEELAFRGFLLRRFISAEFTDVSYQRFTWLSFLASSIAFGLMHGRWIAGIMAGMAFGYTVYRRGKLGDAIVAHAVSNIIIAAYVLIFEKWSLWI